MSNKDKGSTGQSILFFIFAIIAILIFAALIVGPLLLALYSLSSFNENKKWWAKTENKKWWAFAGLLISTVILLYVQSPASSEEFGKGPAIFYGNVLGAVVSSIIFFVHVFGNNEVAGSKKFSSQRLNTKFLLVGVVPTLFFLCFATLMHFQSPFKERMVEENQEMLRIAEQTVNIRKFPTTQSNILLKARAGDLFPYRSAMGNMWAEIELPDGNSGYVFVPLTLRAWKKVMKPKTEYKVNFFHSTQNLLFSGFGAFFWSFLIYAGTRMKQDKLTEEKSGVSNLEQSEENDPNNNFSFERSVDCLKKLHESGEMDPLLFRAAETVVLLQSVPFSLLQRQFHIGLIRSRLIIDQMEEIGLVGPLSAKARVVNIPYGNVLKSIFKEAGLPNIEEVN